MKYEAGAHLDDVEIASRVRMLMREDIDHEMVCVMARDRILSLSKQCADLLEACKAAKKFLEPDLVEPGRAVFWNLVEAIKKAEGRA